ncbi:MAG: class I SAM-dependent methyltransferase [Candidatus Pacearchaeota archaeon]|jgi:SAM-dependent methyltransferase
MEIILKERLDRYLDSAINDKPRKYFITRKIIFLNQYVPDIPKDSKKSLDIGSNYGHITEFLKEKGYDSYGLEVQKKLVEYTNKNGKAKYKYGSAEKMPFKNNTFDVITCLATLEHFIDRSKAMKEINRVLKEDGKVIFTVPNTWSYFYIRSFITFMLRGMKPWTNTHYQQNYFHWIHQIHQFLKIIDCRPLLAIPFIEPKLVTNSFLSKFEYDKPKISWMSAEPFIICTKRTNKIEDNSDEADFTI